MPAEAVNGAPCSTLRTAHSRGSGFVLSPIAALPSYSVRPAFRMPDGRMDVDAIDALFSVARRKPSALVRRRRARLQAGRPVRRGHRPFPFRG